MGSVVVIGGTAGIGRGIAEQYAERGGSVALTGRNATTAEVIDASVFLLENGSVNGVDLRIDGGWREH